MTRRRPVIEVHPRIRVMTNASILLGPGKADLLEAIERAGSLRAAAAELGMSYMRAWTLVKVMNEGFVEPVVELSRGGQGRGGAHLTEIGKEALTLYRGMEKDTIAAVRRASRRLQKLVR